MAGLAVDVACKCTPAAAGSFHPCPKESAHREMKEEGNKQESLYVSTRELAKRWQCAVSSVGRIAKKNGFARFYLGEGRNGIVRYLRKEVEEFENSRRIASA